MRHLQRLPHSSAVRHLGTPQVLSCLLRLLRCPGNAPLPDLLQAMSDVLPELPVPGVLPAPAFTRALAQRLVDAGLLEAVAGFTGGLLAHACMPGC